MSPIPTAPTIRCAGSSTLIAALDDEPLDHGSALFHPSNLEFASVDVGNQTVNLIPGRGAGALQHPLQRPPYAGNAEALVESARPKRRAGNPLSFRVGALERQCVRDGAGPFTDAVADAIDRVTGRKPELSTSGGTSDARFIKDYCPVVEFGLVGQTMHAIDERVPVADLVALTAIFRRILERYFALRPHPEKPTRQCGVSTGRACGPLIIHPHQIKPVGRRDRPAGRAVAGGERGGEIVRAPFALADQHERADHRAHLMVQEGARRGDDAGSRRRSRVTSRRSSVFTGDLAWHSVERKVVKSCLPMSRCAALCMALRVERARHAPGAAAVEREIGAPVEDAVEIMPLHARRCAR